jgi:hypothetical protein
MTCDANVGYMLSYIKPLMEIAWKTIASVIINDARAIFGTSPDAEMGLMEQILLREHVK